MIPISDTAAQQVVESVGRQIRQSRISQGVSIADLAEQTGLSSSMISRVERGDCGPSLFVIFKVTEALGVSLGSILSDQSD